MRSPPALVVMAKVPTPGAAKTRLIPALGADGAAALARAMAADVFGVARASGLPWRVALTGDAGDPWVATIDAPVEAQADGDLGARLRHALRDGGLAIGTDAPTLSADAVRRAAERLHDDDAVWIPAADGGYVLVGAHPHALGVFDAIPWSSPDTLAASLARARLLGLRTTCGEFWYDVDVPADLAFLRAQLLLLPATVAPHTRAFLRTADAAPLR
jgi:hypothetical protein